MLYKFYNSIKSLLGPRGESLQGDIEWFNAQYEGTIMKTPVIYIEFPEPVAIGEVSKEMMRADITVRIHMVTKVITKVDNTVPDAAIVDHENNAAGARECLRGAVLTQTVVVTPATETEPAVNRTDVISSKLHWVRWQHFHKFQGWMVTTIDFTFKTTEFN